MADKPDLERKPSTTNIDGASSPDQPPNPAVPATTDAEFLKTLGTWASARRLGLPLLLLVALSAVGASFFFSWWQFLPRTIDWINEKSWRWAFGWLAVMFLAVAPGYVVAGAGSALAAALKAAGDRKEAHAFDELAELEGEIRGSTDPVDYARYGRKALEAYYYMGQNQVRVSFFIGVAAMVFGFLFLLAGLLAQIVDVAQIRYLRPDPKIEVVTVGGSLIIEFVAGTFLWIYRAAIVQLNRYYQRQLLVHSALISVAIAEKMPGGKQEALRAIVDRMLTEEVEGALPKLPGRGAATANQAAAQTPSNILRKPDSSSPPAQSAPPNSGLQQTGSSPSLGSRS